MFTKIIENPILIRVKGTPPTNETKIKTTYWIVTKLHTHQDGVNATSHFEFQVDISILATVSEELATLQNGKIGLH